MCQHVKHIKKVNLSKNIKAPYHRLTSSFFQKINACLFNFGDVESLNYFGSSLKGTSFYSTLVKSFFDSVLSSFFSFAALVDCVV